MVDLSPHLLPRQNATSFEIALDLCEERLLDITVPLRDLWNPDACPAHLLPFLAWGLSVDLWEDDWSEGRKRRMCREALTLHRLKGTLEGLRRMLGFIDARIVSAVLPPQGIFARPHDPVRQAAFRARFQQLRLYPFRAREQADYRSCHVGKSFAGSSVARVSTAWKRYGVRAVVWDKGVETPVRWSTQSGAFSPQVTLSTERIVIPARVAPGDAIVGRIFAGGRTFASSRKPRSRMLSLGVERLLDANGRAGISPGVHGLQVLSHAPERVLERGPGPARGFFVGRAPGCFVSRNEAGLRIYDRFYLYDEARAPRGEGRGFGPFVGSARVGIAPFSAHFRIARDYRARGRQFHAGGLVGRSTARTALDRFTPIARAISASAMYRDKLTFTTKTRETLNFAGAPAFAEAPRFGSIVSIRRAA